MADWRGLAKQTLVNGLGGGCNRCGYSRCLAGLDFHHTEPDTKLFTIASALSDKRPWEEIVEEAAKCLILCRICHVELHAGLWKLSDIQAVPLDRAKVLTWGGEDAHQCNECGKAVYSGRRFCSARCRQRGSRKIDWPCEATLRKMLADLPRTKVAVLLGVSDNAIKKHMASRMNT